MPEFLDRYSMQTHLQTEIDALLADGIQAAKTGNRLIARLRLEKVAALDPKNADCWTWLAWTSESPHSALLALQEAIASDRDHKIALQGLSWIRSLCDFEVPFEDASPANVVLAPADVKDEDETKPYENRPSEPSDSNDAAPAAPPVPADEEPFADSMPPLTEVFAEDDPSSVASGTSTSTSVGITDRADSPAVVEDIRLLPPQTVRDNAPSEWLASLAEPAFVPLGPDHGHPCAAKKDSTIEPDDRPIPAIVPPALPESGDTIPDTLQEITIADQIIENVTAMRDEFDQLRHDSGWSPTRETDSSKETDYSVNLAAALEQSAEQIVNIQDAVIAPTEISPEPVPPTILAVDDSPTVRKLISITLEKHGFRVITAEDGMTALQFLSADPPGLVLTDINMPRLDGYQLCKLIKKHEKTRSIPVIMLSGKDGMFDKLRGRLVGCNDYITKPFESAEIIKKVSSYLPVPQPTG
jgi:twitching motility two-component system response regulator PilG